MSLCAGCNGANSPTTCDKCSKPLCTNCAKLVMPKRVSGDLLALHKRCVR